MSNQDAIFVIWHLLQCFILSTVVILGKVIKTSPKDKTLFEIILSNPTRILIAYVISTALIWVLTDKLFRFIDDSVKTKSTHHPIRGCDLHKSYISGIKTASVIVICWLPYYIICYPTITRGYDFFWQLLQGMGLFPLSSHHPVFGSIIFGALFKLGYMMGGASFGLGLISFSQMVLLSLSLGFAFAVLRIITVMPRKVYYVLLGYICLCPVFPGHAVWAIKDVFFTAVTILMFSQFLLHIWCVNRSVHIPVIASLPFFTISAVLFSLFRNGTTPIAVTLFFVMLCFNAIICRKKHRALRSTLAMLAFLTAMFLWNNLLSAMNVYPTNIREALALPTRQIIRTVQMHPEELDDESEAFLKSLYYEQVANGKELNSIINRYDDYIADYIKIDYMNDDFSMPKYLKYWINLGGRHPGSYLDALMRGTDGYWYYGKTPHLEANETIIHTVCTTGPEDDFANEAMLDMRLDSLFLPTVKSLEYAGMNTDMTFREICMENVWLDELMHVRSEFPSARKELGDYLAKLEQIPIISLALAPGTYFFLLIVCFTYMIERKRIGRFLWPVFLIEALAWLSPVNGYTRYVLPVELIAILLIGVCFTDESSKGDYVKQPEKNLDY